MCVWVNMIVRPGVVIKSLMNTRTNLHTDQDYDCRNNDSYRNNQCCFFTDITSFTASFSRRSMFAAAGSVRILFCHRNPPK